MSRTRILSDTSALATAEQLRRGARRGNIAKRIMGRQRQSKTPPAVRQADARRAAAGPRPPSVAESCAALEAAFPWLRE